MAAQKSMDSATARIKRLENSLELISANIASLEATPAARARTSPVMVLFVPYTNAENVRQGEPLFSCAFSIVVCSEVGQVGGQIDGETVSVHPLFGKPMRGTFIEAEFNDARSVTEELMHAGRKPLWF